jgi:RNA polymerase sigma factor (TIGR02999 family)
MNAFLGKSFHNPTPEFEKKTDKIFPIYKKKFRISHKMSPKKVTQQMLAERNENENCAALEALLPLVYDELHRIAAGYMRRENIGHTLQPTALVHEAYLKLVDQRNVDWQNRAQFFGVAANLMRRILLKHAERKHAEKRGGARLPKIELDAADIFSEAQNTNFLALEEALRKLAARDCQKARIVELKFFGGLKTGEIAEVIGKSTKTVERDWIFAKAWLKRELKR